MSAELLREAAALMRNHAEGAIPGPWRARLFNGEGQVVDEENDVIVVGDLEDAFHIASWHTDVALAVADWLDDMVSDTYLGSITQGRAFAVARAYLGRDS